MYCLPHFCLSKLRLRFSKSFIFSKFCCSFYYFRSFRSFIVIYSLISLLFIQPVFATGSQAGISQTIINQDRAQLKAIFQESKQISQQNSHGLNKNITQRMVQGTKAYHTRMNGNLLSLQDKREITAPSKKPAKKTLKTQYHIQALDSFAAAKLLVDQGLNPLVLNMANKNAIGGGVESGAKAQEESLFRCSNYFLALYPQGHSKANKDPVRKFYRHPIQEFGSYYTPHVQVFRDSGQGYAFIQPFTVSCLAMAGYDLGKPYKLEKRIKNTAGIDLRAFKKYTKLKIRHMLEVAMLQGHDSLVLGAISCGAFRLPNDNQGITATIVAAAYKEVLQEPRYQNRFANITFAILPAGKIGNMNYQVFDNMVKQLGPADIS